MLNADKETLLKIYLVFVKDVVKENLELMEGVVLIVQVTQTVALIVIFSLHVLIAGKGSLVYRRIDALKLA